MFYIHKLIHRFTGNRKEALFQEEVVKFKAFQDRIKQDGVKIVIAANDAGIVLPQANASVHLNKAFEVENVVMHSIRKTVPDGISTNRNHSYELAKKRSKEMYDLLTDPSPLPTQQTTTLVGHEINLEYIPPAEVTILPAALGIDDQIPPAEVTILPAALGTDDQIPPAEVPEDLPAALGIDELIPRPDAGVPIITVVRKKQMPVAPIPPEEQIPPADIFQKEQSILPAQCETALDFVEHRTSVINASLLTVNP